MKYSNSFGKESSKILLGTAYFGDTISEDSAFHIMDVYREMGGTHIDTARLYAGGESEKVVSRWFKSRKPQNMRLSTKGAFPNPETPNVPRVNEKEIRHDLDLSLKALDVDSIEFYWLHRDDENQDAGEIIEIMNSLVKEGKILRFGASNWRHQRVDRANSYAKEHGLQGFSGAQIRFSPAIISPDGNADRTLVDMSEEAFDYYKENNIPVAAYASQAKGFFSKMATIGESGLNVKSKERYLCEENLKRLDVIKALSEKYSISVASTVCASLINLENPDVYAIIGGSKPEQIVDSMSGCDTTFEKNELEEIFKYKI
ncbi:MAG: aldo/keto reductase [Ruminococcaceae bacterium]|nr:aldo/keto reductase [Oscillospiraceae bacterium]